MLMREHRAFNFACMRSYSDFSFLWVEKLGWGRSISEAYCIVAGIGFGSRRFNVGARYASPVRRSEMGFSRLAPGILRVNLY